MRYSGFLLQMKSMFGKLIDKSVWVRAWMVICFYVALWWTWGVPHLLHIDWWAAVTPWTRKESKENEGIKNTNWSVQKRVGSYEGIQMKFVFFVSLPVLLYLSVSFLSSKSRPFEADSHLSQAWFLFCWKFLPVKTEFFLSVDANVLLRMGICDKVKIPLNLLASLD